MNSIASGQMEQYQASVTYLPYLEQDELYLQTECEIEQLDEMIDLLGLRITEDQVKDGKAIVTPGQFEYLKIVKEYQEKMEKI